MNNRSAVFILSSLLSLAGVASRAQDFPPGTATSAGQLVRLAKTGRPAAEPSKLAATESTPVIVMEMESRLKAYLGSDKFVSDLMDEKVRKTCASHGPRYQPAGKRWYDAHGVWGSD